MLSLRLLSRQFVNFFNQLVRQSALQRILGHRKLQRIFLFLLLLFLLFLLFASSSPTQRLGKVNFCDLFRSWLRFELRRIIVNGLSHVFQKLSCYLHWGRVLIQVGDEW